MRSEMNMTIQDYFRKSGLRTPAVGNSHGRIFSGGQEDGSFSRALAAAQSSSRSASEPRGLRFQDYVAHPLPAKNLYSLYTDAPPQLSLPQEPTQDQDGHMASAKIRESASSTADSDRRRGVHSEKDQILVAISRASQKYNLPSKLIRAVVKAESGYQVSAVSPAGAQGLMQLMPATAKELGVRNPFDIQQNIDGGAKYLRQMLDQFDGDIRLALSAYNAGPGTVARYDGDVPYTETRNYVERVLRFSRNFS